MITIDGQPWFVAMDALNALNALEYPRVSHSMIFKKLDESEAGLNRIDICSGGHTRKHPVRIVSESGLYKLIMRSDKEEKAPIQEERTPASCLLEWPRSLHEHYLTNTIRVITIDGQPWFVAAEHARLLYNTTTGLTHVYARLDANEKKLVTRADGDCFHLFGTSRAPRLLLISESGLYKLIMRSDKPQAKPFQDWVTKVVLPAIRVLFLTRGRQVTCFRGSCGLTIHPHHEASKMPTPCQKES